MRFSRALRAVPHMKLANAVPLRGQCAAAPQIMPVSQLAAQLLTRPVHTLDSRLENRPMKSTTQPTMQTDIHEDQRQRNPAR
jgi:hypothetical protein